nr:MAG TPA: hypothetical protein [Crassvirales sp.]
MEYWPINSNTKILCLDEKYSKFLKTIQFTIAILYSFP